MSIAAVLFDADGVVQRQAASWRELMSGLKPEGDIDAFCRDFFAAEAPTLVDQGDFEAVVADLLKKWNCPVSPDEALQVWRAIVVDQGVVEQIKAVRAAGFFCGLATNQQAYRARFMSEELGYGVLFDQSFYSCELGYRKPDPGYFIAVLTRLSVAAEQVLFIDDSAANIEAACSAGLRGVLFAPEEGVEWGGALQLVLEEYGVL